jgi:hypothetical protein
MQIVLKELREAHFRIKLVKGAEFAPSEDEILKFLFNESSELLRIIAKSIVTAKSKNLKSSS